MYVCNHQIKKEKAILSPDWDIFRLAGGIYIHNTQGGQPKFLVVSSVYCVHPPIWLSRYSTVYGVLLVLSIRTIFWFRTWNFFQLTFSCDDFKKVQKKSL